MEDESLLLTIDGAIATVTFNRPEKANAFAPDWIERITSFLRQVDLDEQVRCVVFRAMGKHFLAGADIERLSEIATDPDVYRRLSWFEGTIGAANAMARAIRLLSKPVIAGVQGAAIGGAFTILAACDLVLASDDAFFNVGQILFGYSLDGMPSYFLPRIIGHKKAMEWSLLGSRISAVEAKNVGFINFIVPASDLDNELDKLAVKLAAGPTKAYAINKRLFASTWQNSFEDQAALELELYLGGVQTADWAEGTAAFLQKRTPRFEGQ